MGVACFLRDAWISMCFGEARQMLSGPRDQRRAGRRICSRSFSVRRSNRGFHMLVRLVAGSILILAACPMSTPIEGEGEVVDEGEGDIGEGEGEGGVGEGEGEGEGDVGEGEG